MPRTIEVTVSPTGETRIQTRGYSGDDCLAASKFLEEALGNVTHEQKTVEYHETQTTFQHLQQ